MLPPDLDLAIDEAWQKAQNVPGYLGEKEFRALMMLFAGTSSIASQGVAVEIGSFKGKSAVGLATLSARYGWGPVISIDPHTAPCETDPDLGEQESSFDDFLSAIRDAGVEQFVEAHRELSSDAAKGWNHPIRFLWIDGDHTYQGAKLDFDLFTPFLVKQGIVALHDTLHEFEGPIRVFVEDMLQSDAYGPAGLLHTIGWAQYLPDEGVKYKKRRERLAKRAGRLIPLVKHGREITRFLWKIECAWIPHDVFSPSQWQENITRTE